MNQTAAVWLPWVSVCLTIVNIVLLPTVSIIVDWKIERLLAKHNLDPHAHPDSRQMAKVETKIDALGEVVSRELGDLRVAIERITPRRREGE